MLKICVVFSKSEPHYTYKRYAFILNVMCCYLVGSVSKCQVLKGVVRADNGHIRNISDINSFDLQN